MFTFSDLAATLETISLVPLAVNVPPENSTDVGDGTDVVDDVVVTLEDMCKFDVVNAKCFDPNEERKLLTVIDEVGRDKFHSSIRQLSRCCLDRYNADVEMAKGASSPGGIAKSTFSRHSSERR